MKHLLTAWETVLPLLLIMAVGWLLNRSHAVPRDVFLGLNRIVYYVGLPCLIFHKLLREDTVSTVDWPVIVFTVVAIVLLFLLGWLIVPRFVSDPKRRGAITQASLRSNDSIFSLAVASAMLGDGNFGLTIFTSAISAATFNLLAVITLELNRSGKVSIGSFLIHLVRNPVILAVAAGCLFRLVGWTLPTVLDKPIGYLSDMVTPVGFLMLGGLLSFRSVQTNRKALLCITVTKLVLVPLVLVSTAIALGFRGLPLLTVLLIFAAPTAMASYPLASELESDAELAGEAVAVTTACSLPTVFLFLTVFGGLLL